MARRKPPVLGLMTRRPNVGVQEMPLPVRRLIETAIRHAFNLVAAGVGNPPINLQNAAEIAITERLEDILNQLRNDPNEPVRGFTASKFETVIRGGEIKSADGSKLEKRPDLTFRLGGYHPGVIDSRTDGMFVEFKIVDPDHRISIYCSDGLIRFVRGNYACLMRHGLIVAYNRDGYDIATALAAYLESHRTEYQLVSNLQPRLNEPVTVPVYLTRHGRSFIHPTLAGSPGEIEVAHLWLDLSTEVQLVMGF